MPTHDDEKPPTTAPEHSEPSAAPPRLVLASRSPRRAALLAEAGVPFVVATPPFDDPAQPDRPADGDVAQLAVELAAAKARSLAEVWPDVPVDREVILLAADTLCIDAEGHPAGKPQTRDELLTMLAGFVDNTHAVTTGVALIPVVSGREVATPQLDRIATFSDTVDVTWGHVSDQEVAAYAETTLWHGKAGGYNLEERGRHWPITTDGDPTTVVGLPMRKLFPQLQTRGVIPLTGPKTRK